jgi:hypothetical protein
MVQRQDGIIGVCTAEVIIALGFGFVYGSSVD